MASPLPLTILRTKLHLPAVTPDLVCRQRLHELLDTALTRPLTLVSAPAGYGKSTLLAHWAESLRDPCAWLSLDETDGELYGFLGYFLEAVRELFPATCHETEALFMSGEPSPALLASTLANELDALDAPFVLVLDDYHRLGPGSGVHELLRQLLHHPPRPLHLVLATRSDPPLPLASLRARTELTEVRLEDLRFSRAETATLLTGAGGAPPSDEALANLEQQFEGWAVGLRLTVLALRHTADPEAFLSSLQGGFAAVQDYLVQEVLAAQSESMQDWMLKTSLLDRFCSTLCEAVCGSPDDSSASSRMGEEFTEALRGLNLFCISLDSRQEWSRYHHQFQLLLQTQLGRRLGPEEISALHSRASAWFAEQGWIEEAIVHALRAGDPEGAADLAEANRMAALDNDRWYLLEKWLALLPEPATRRRPGLLMARAWLHAYRLTLAGLPPLLDEVDALLGSAPEQVALAGEVDYFRGYFAYFGGEGARSREHLKAALSKVPVEHIEVYGEIELHLALANQMVGQLEEGLRPLERLLVDLDALHPLRRTRVLAGLIFTHVIADDLGSASSRNGLLERVSEEADFPFALAWSYFVQGLVHFRRHELHEAESYLARSIEPRYTPHRRLVADALVGLALIREALGQSEEANAARRRLVEYARMHSEPGAMLLAESCKQRLSLLRGEPAPGLGGGAESPPTEAMIFWLDIPAITHCRCLLAEGSAENLEEAERRLRECLAFNEAQHNTRWIIEILPLLALVRNRRGQEEEALALLERAVTLAAPGGSVRPFLEPGRPVAELLRRLPSSTATKGIVRTILELFEGASIASPTPTESRVREAAAPAAEALLVEDLTDREQEILQLLAERFQNKEIAGRLFISTHTVNDHLKNVYGKLGVHGRRQAVERARALGLLGVR